MTDAGDDWTRRFGEYWRRDCLELHGRVLTGNGRHWCLAHYGVPMDDSMPDWPCLCVAKGHVDGSAER